MDYHSIFLLVFPTFTAAFLSDISYIFLIVKRKIQSWYSILSPLKILECFFLSEKYENLNKALHDMLTFSRFISLYSLPPSLCSRPIFLFLESIMPLLVIPGINSHSTLYFYFLTLTEIYIDIF